MPSTEPEYDEATLKLIRQCDRLNEIIDARLAKANWSPWSAVAVSVALASLFTAVFAVACYYAVH